MLGCSVLAICASAAKTMILAILNLFKNILQTILSIKATLTKSSNRLNPWRILNNILCLNTQLVGSSKLNLELKILFRILSSLVLTILSTVTIDLNCMDLIF